MELILTCLRDSIFNFKNHLLVLFMIAEINVCVLHNFKRLLAMFFEILKTTNQIFLPVKFLITDCKNVGFVN